MKKVYKYICKMVAILYYRMTEIPPFQISQKAFFFI